jgi:hypothetical protein
MSAPTGFLARVRLDPAGPDRWAAAGGGTERMTLGLLGAQAMVAAGRTVDTRWRWVHAVHVTRLDEGDPGPAVQHQVERTYDTGARAVRLPAGRHRGGRQRPARRRPGGLGRRDRRRGPYPGPLRGGRGPCVRPGTRRRRARAATRVAGHRPRGAARLARSPAGRPGRRARAGQTGAPARAGMTCSPTRSIASASSPAGIPPMSM